MTPTKSIPPPNPGDSGEVTEALEVASKLWTTGNRRDAIRWVRRAAQAADEAGDSQRMSALARVSADLEESLPESASPTRAKTTPPPLPPQASRPGPAPTAPQKSGLRFRVSVKTSILDPTIFIIRRLEDGMAVPAGTSEGWLETSTLTEVDTASVNGKSVQ